jgi:hypothetical protein
MPVDFSEALQGAAALFVGYVFVEVRSLIRRRVEDREREALLFELAEAVEIAVLSVGQTYLSARKPGEKLSLNEAAEAKGQAADVAREILGPARLAKLERLLAGKFGAVLGSQIEAAVARLKERQK